MSTDTHQPPKVSFCLTCKGRLEHVKRSLPHNLAATAHDANVQFVVLDYDSPDGLGEWIKENYQAEIDSGRIKYARLMDPSPFRMSHAKNMAHRLADGEILCNLDADNLLPEGFGHWLQTTFAQTDGIKAAYVQPHPGVSAVHKFTKGDIQGINGRIACRKEDFLRVRGYDEEMDGSRQEDADFAQRLEAAGVSRINLPISRYGSVLQHTDEDRVRHMGEKDKQSTATHLIRGASFVEKASRAVWGDPKVVRSHPEANRNGEVGCGRVCINFSDTIQEIGPLDLVAAPPALPRGRGR